MINMLITGIVCIAGIVLAICTVELLVKMIIR